METIRIPALGGAKSTLLAFRGCSLTSGTTAQLKVGGSSPVTVEVVDSSRGAMSVSAAGRISEMQISTTGGRKFTGGSILVWIVSEPYTAPGIHTADTSRATADTTIFTADAI